MTLKVTGSVIDRAGSRAISGAGIEGLEQVKGGATSLGKTVPDEMSDGGSSSRPTQRRSFSRASPMASGRGTFLDVHDKDEVAAVSGAKSLQIIYVNASPTLSGR
jgi:hypothetical protein